MLNELTFDQDMNKPVVERQISGSLVEGGNIGLKLIVRLNRNGEPAEIDDTINCTVMTSDGQTKVIASKNCGSDGNTAWARIPSSALTAGLVRIVLWASVASTSTRTPLLVIAGAVKKTLGDTYVNTGSVIPSLSSYTTLVNNAKTTLSNIEKKLKVSAKPVLDNVDCDRYQITVTKTGS